MTVDIPYEDVVHSFVQDGQQHSQDSSSQTAQDSCRLFSRKEKQTSAMFARFLNIDQSLGVSLKNRKWIRYIFLTSSYVALLLDFMLYSVIVPVVPAYLVDAQRNNSNLKLVNDDNIELNWTTNSTITLSDRHENSYGLGILFSSKSIVHVMLNPLVGYLNDKLQATLPLIILGHLVCGVSTVLYGFGTTYWTLLVARMVQGVGTALTVTSVSTAYSRFWTDSDGRQRVVGCGVFIVAAGCLIGVPFGAFLDHFGGKPAPFLTLAGATLFNVVILLFVAAAVVRQTYASRAVDGTTTSSESITSFDVEDKHPEMVTNSDLKRLPRKRQYLLMDPYIIIGAGSLFAITLTVACTDPIIYLWMEQKMSATELQFGLVWLPSLIPYAVAVWFSDFILRRFPGSEWWLCIMGHVFTGLGCLLLPVCSSVFQLVFPLSAMLFGYSLTEVTIMPLFSTIVDNRHPGSYGSVAAITSNSYEVALSVGPIFGDYLARSYGFEAVPFTVGVVIILYAPFYSLYRNFNRVYSRLE